MSKEPEIKMWMITAVVMIGGLIFIGVGLWKIMHTPDGEVWSHLGH